MNIGNTFDHKFLFWILFLLQAVIIKMGKGIAQYYSYYYYNTNYAYHITTTKLQRKFTLNMYNLYINMIEPYSCKLCMILVGWIDNNRLTGQYFILSYDIY